MLRETHIYNILVRLVTVEWVCFFIATSLCNGNAMHGSRPLQIGFVICGIILFIHSMNALARQCATTIFVVVSITSLVLLPLTIFHFAPAYKIVITTSYALISRTQYFIECSLRLLQCLSALYALATSIKEIRDTIANGSIIEIAQIVVWSIVVLSMSAILLCSLYLKTYLLISVYLFSLAFRNCTVAIYQKYKENRGLE